MICIFSNAEDYSTTDVIRWLHHFGKKDVIRVNYNDDNIDNGVKIDVVEGDFCFNWNHQLIRLSDIEMVWYRKGKNWLCDYFYPVTIEGHKHFTSYLNNKLKQEEAKLAEYLHHLIENSVPMLGSSKRSSINKLIALSAAKEIGLLVPDFYITNHQDGINHILDQSQELITKSISDGLYLFEKEETGMGYFSYTEKVNDEKNRNLEERISPSFLQKSIEKKIELRIFVLEEKCYAMAIFSQMDEKTKTDFRKYNEDKPNRFVPYKLPDEIEQKVKKLFTKLNLSTGSMDMIIDQQGAYYFLEINPVGQFGMVSEPCNQFLEKKIALYLLKHAKRNGTHSPS